MVYLLIMTRCGQNGFEHNVFLFPARCAWNVQAISEKPPHVCAWSFTAAAYSLFNLCYAAVPPSKRFMGFLTRNRRRRALVRPYNFRLISENRCCHTSDVCVSVRKPPSRVHSTIYYYFYYFHNTRHGGGGGGLFEFPRSFLLPWKTHITRSVERRRARRPPSAWYIYILYI